MQFGGCISHHHGVGKLRKRFMEKTASPLNATAIDGVKKALDPNNVFGINNTVYRSEDERAKDLAHKVT